jgi:hypothetical protein
MTLRSASLPPGWEPGSALDRVALGADAARARVQPLYLGLR